jgi:hypothetical protein
MLVDVAIFTLHSVLKNRGVTEILCLDCFCIINFMKGNFYTDLKISELRSSRRVMYKSPGVYENH